MCTTLAKGERERDEVLCESKQTKRRDYLNHFSHEVCDLLRKRFDGNGGWNGFEKKREDNNKIEQLMNPNCQFSSNLMNLLHFTPNTQQHEMKRDERYKRKAEINKLRV